jgi:hypothetical protein
MLEVERTELWLRARVKPHSAHRVARGGIAEVPVAERLRLRVGALGGFVQEVQHVAEAPHDTLAGVPPATRDRHETDFDARLLHGSAFAHSPRTQCVVFCVLHHPCVDRNPSTGNKALISTNAMLTATLPPCVCACICVRACIYACACEEERPCCSNPSPAHVNCSVWSERDACMHVCAERAHSAARSCMPHLHMHGIRRVAGSRRSAAARPARHPAAPRGSACCPRCAERACPPEPPPTPHCALLDAPQATQSLHTTRATGKLRAASLVHHFIKRGVAQLTDNSTYVITGLV